MVAEPQGAHTCRSSRLAVLDYSGPFPGLLLTILGPRVIFMVAEPQGALMCRSSSVAVLGDSGPFHGLLLTVLGVPERFPRLTNRRVPLRVGHQHS